VSSHSFMFRIFPAPAPARAGVARRGRARVCMGGRDLNSSTSPSPLWRAVARLPHVPLDEGEARLESPRDMCRVAICVVGTICVEKAVVDAALKLGFVLLLLPGADWAS